VGLSILENVDPNPDNFVSAGILNTTSVLVGCLLRLEPNKAKQVRHTSAIHTVLCSNSYRSHLIAQ